ncbi:Putative paxillin-like protein [Septoria linicola]|uniref:Paxillin-like protein n=1 Tax=Septoria linicola TaxID=215465 RepID=A0A9Q9AE28_9PEZI|nr:putative paxillin-like protein [Septoria linicola]USW47420.1 Putative paxillin-like protein [Septoria linicola]
MADHICSGEDAGSPPKSRIPHIGNPFTLRQYGAGDAPYSQSQQRREEPTQTHRRAPTLNKKPSRIALPKINATAANLSYANPRQNGMDTPMTPGVSGGKPAFLRSATSPMPRLFDPRPPSPELSANLDCAFPPFPASGSSSGLRRPSTSQGRRTPGSDRAQSRSDSRSTSRTDNHNLTVEDPYSYEPKSPRTNGGENVLQRLNTLKSGPFAAKRQGSAESKDGSSVVERRPSASDAHVRPSTAVSNQSHSSQPTTSAASGHGQADTSRIPKKVAPQRPSRPSEEQFSPAFLDQFSAEPSELSQSPSTATSISHLASRELATDSHNQQALTKQRSEPALRRPSLANAPASALPIPPRSQSRSAARVDYRLQDAPPVPKPVLQHRQQASMHTPSESDASTVSTAQSSNYTDHTSSTRPSPAGSVEALSPLAAALSMSDHDEQLRPAGLNVRSQQKPGERAELPLQASPPRSFTRPAPLTATPARREDFYDLESPMDPAMLPTRSVPAHEPWTPSQESTFFTSPVDRPAVANDAMLNDTIHPSALAVPSGNLLSRRDLPRSSSKTQNSVSHTVPEVASVLRAPPEPEQPQQKRQHVRRPTIGHKPICRGCGHGIEGKSVKAADGRLTGRWHKACFVCRSCEAPFMTADFYVINNQPYCEHHYHEQNGSLCHGCNHGIEGQYLETTSSTRQGVVENKYHPRCFTCSQCRMVLTDDYFEISSRVYCERHALAAMRVQARAAGIQGLYPTDQRTIMAERRTTRLINPLMA